MMKNYNFLFKPFFFICSLLFATWLVFYIESISPSDLGRYESLFNNKQKSLSKEQKAQSSITYNKQCLKKICGDYKAGLIDSTTLDQQLEKFLKDPLEIKQK
jgi:hypothetical protein